MARDVLITPASGLIDFLDTSVSKATLTLGTDGILVLTGGSNPIVIETSTSGSSALRVDGTNGTLFEVVDDLSGSLMSVNDAAGLPVLEVFADNHIVAGRYNQNDFYLDTNGNLGLGTATPSFQLDVSGGLRIYQDTTSAGSGLGVTIENDGTGDSVVQFVLTGTRRWVAGIDNSDSDKFKIASSSDLNSDARLTIQTNGDVGIGTISPGAKLAVDGGAHFANEITIKGDASGSLGNASGLRLYQNDTTDISYILNYYTGGMALGVGNAEKMRITNGGNVGIGTTDPQHKLQISSAQSGGIQFTYDSTNNYRNQILNYWNSSTDSRMDFNVAYTSGATPTTIMSVGYGGNVGIGTTGPSNPLHISYSGASSVQGLYIHNTNNAADAGIKFSDASTASQNGIFYYAHSDAHSNGTGNSFHFNSDQSTLAVILDQTSGNSGYYIGESSPVVAIRGGGASFFNGGNVGIGTSNPQSTLHISKTAPIISLTDTNSFSDANDRLIFRAGANQGLIQWYDDSASTTSSIAVFNSSGNVGIGTTSPNSKTEILIGARSTNFAASNGATWHDLIVRNPDNTQNAAVGLAFELNSTYHENAAAGIAAVKEVGSSDYGAGLAFVTRPQSAVAVERVRIDSSGNVGIGTASPSYKLHVSGNSYIDATLANPTLTLGRYSGQPSIKAGSDDGGYLLMDSSGGRAGLNWYSSDHVILANGGGNVGIGQSNPVTKLHIPVNNTSTHNPSSYTNNGVKALTLRTQEGDGLEWHLSHSSNGYVGWVAAARANNVGGSWGDGYLEFTTAGSSSGAGNANVLVLTGTGNVGIGTASPERNLHVFKGESSGATSNSDSTLVLENSSNTYLQFLTPSTSEAGVLFGDSDNDRGALTYNHSTDSMNFRIAASTRMFIDSAGDVGIGTTSPFYKLDITDSKSTGYGLRVNGGGNGGPLALFQRNVGGSGYVEIKSYNSDPTITFGTSNTFSIGVDGYTFKISDNTYLGVNDRLIIDSAGDVGIGVTSALAKLHVGGKVRINTIDTDATLTDFIVVDSNGELHKRTGGSGTSGTSGTSGESGSSGSSGSSGDSGSSGTSGDSGTSGTSGDSASVGGSNDQYVYRTGSTSVASGCLCHATNKVVVNQGAEFRVTGPATSFNTHFNYNNTGANYITSCGDCTFIRGYNGSSVSNGVVASATGAVGVGGNPSSEALKIHGTTCATQQITSSSYICTCGDFCTDGDVCCTSDARFKTDVTPIRPIGGLACTIMSMRGVEYKWKNDSPAVKADPEKINRCNLGFIAQEVEKAIPSAVSCGKGEYFEDERKISTGGILAMLLELVKEHQLKIEQLENKVSELENRVNILGQCVTE